LSMYACTHEAYDPGILAQLRFCRINWAVVGRTECRSVIAHDVEDAATQGPLIVPGTSPCNFPTNPIRRLGALIQTRRCQWKLRKSQ
jgi:hypothetical protein